MILNPTSQTYDNLLLAYRFLNEKLFEGILPPCLITLQREKKSYGYFSPERFKYANDPKHCTDEIALNPQYFRSADRDDCKVISTLAHEMAHLWQHHFGKPGRVRYHNQEWADKMKAIGLIPSSTGAAGGKETGDQMSHYIDPCGPFALAFKDLAAQKFTLQWIEAPEPQGTAIQPLKRLPPNTTPSEPIEADNEGISMPFEDEQTPSLHVPMPDKSNRLKYSCPGCSLNAWAKPGANLICGDCEEPMNYSN